MRFYTHKRTPPIKTHKSVKIMLGISIGLIIAFILMCSIYAETIMPAVVILVSVLLFVIIQKDMDKAFVEIVNDVITVSDSYFGIKKEKVFSVHDISYAEICTGYSMRVRGYRYSNAGMTYIVFRNNYGKYMFKIICCPETKAFFGDYLQLQSL